MTSMLVLEICTAYEQGYGHGYDKRDVKNPWATGNAVKAWSYGYAEGLRKRLSDDEIRDEVRRIERSRGGRESREELYSRYGINWTKKPVWADVWIEHKYNPGGINYSGWYRSLNERHWETECGSTALEKASDSIKAYYPPWVEK